MRNPLVVVQIKASLGRPGFNPQTWWRNRFDVVQIKAFLERLGFEPVNMVAVFVAQSFSICPNQSPSGEAGIPTHQLGGSLGGAMG